jgi:two-component system, sensor histidine kinase PdtaS
LIFYNRYRVKKKSNAEKEVLLKEIHHRVKNNLQLVISLLEWQAENETDEKVNKIIDEGRSRVESMALIHESLYKTENMARINSADYLANLVRYLGTSYNKSQVRVETSIDEIFLDVDIAIPVGLIVNELVSNAFKYAFPFRAEGLIKIELMKHSSSTYKLKIEDNGIGLPVEWSELSSHSLGLQLVKTLVKQLKAQLDVTVTAGTLFEIYFTNNVNPISAKGYPAKERKFNTTTPAATTV